MAKHVTEDRNGHLRTTVTLEPGEQLVDLCRCMQSKDFPFCDGTHKTLPGIHGPVIVRLPEQEEPKQG